jgi:hypothetical protein
MTHPGGAREVDRAGELGHDRQDFLDRRGRVVPHGDVETFRRDILIRPVGHGAFDTSGNGFDDRGVEQPGFCSLGQFVSEGVCLFRRDVETEDFYGDQPVTYGLVGSKDRPERANADLMQHPEGAERGRRCERRRIVSGQFWELLEAGLKKCNTI